MSVVKFKADRLPIFHLVIVFLTQLTLYVGIQSPVGLLIAAVVMTPICFLTVPITHNHFHLAIFNKQSLNRIIELILFLQNGFTEGTWKPTHNLHHAHYLDPRARAERHDPNTWIDAKTGTQLELYRYVIPFMWGHFRRHASMSGRRLKYGSSWSVRVVRALVLAALIVIHPFAALCLFFLPMAVSQLLTAIHGYYQHAGLETDDPYEASFNYHGPFFLYNIGYHTAHHLQPGLHWSRLPAAHQRIEMRIPRNNMVSCYLCLSTYTKRILR
jgi:fatty acid desaturase